MKKIDLAGQCFGMLTVLEEVEERTKDGRVQWLCKCNCGNVSIVKGKHLRNGTTKSCGCLVHKRRYKDLSGYIFGNLKVLNYAYTKKGRAYYFCKCCCGNETTVIIQDLLSGHTKSCGCLSRELTSKRMKVDITGQKFGRLFVLREVEKRTTEGRIQWLCKCDCGNEVIVMGKRLRNGNTKSCGCFQKELIRKAGESTKLIVKHGQRFGMLTTIRELDERTKYGKVQWLCKCDCGADKIVTSTYLIAGHTNKSCGCIKSHQESDIYNFIRYIIPDDTNVLRNNRTLIKPLELDIIVPDKKIAIEYCGLYWHSQKAGKSRHYHLNKLNRCNEIGYNLITVFEDEWLNKKIIVKSRLRNLLGCTTNRVFARKCVIKEIVVSEARVFCDKNHLQGYSSSSVKLGAFYNNELVSVMLFGKPSIARGAIDMPNRTFELIRFCSELNYNVIGIASKLLKYFQRHYDWERIYSFADKRWSNGNVYNKLGFNFLHNNKPTYTYFNGDGIRHHRYGFRKDILKDKFDFFDPELTEWEMMQTAGYNRIFDCGTSKYQLESIGG